MVSSEDIRPASPTDYDAIVGVADIWWGRDVTATLPRLFLDHFATSSLVAEDGEGLAGFLVGLDSSALPHVGYIHFAGVRPDRRRDGLARRLYADFTDRARMLGCREVRAITSPMNAASIGFHRALGFEVSEPVPDYNGPGRAMVTFRLPLTPPSS